jgi:predicted nuclease of restriction endonuclease-like (RecB) superfamily
MDDAVCIGWIQGARSLERDLHQALNRYRQDGEWFEWNPKVELLVTAMIADELNVKDAILRAIEDPKILENLDHNYLSTNFLEKEIENAEEELVSLVNEETW